MPVPVPRFSKPPAHPVVKSFAQGHPLQNIIGPLPVQNQGAWAREESRGSLPSWRRTQQRPSWDQAIVQPAQDFHQGLTAADNASVIKGPHAEACIPPMYSLLQDHNGVASTIYARDAEDDIASTRSARNQAQFDSNGMWDVTGLAAYNAGNAYAGNTYPHNLSPTDASAAYTYQLNGFTPIFEDQSPGSASGPDSGSSPLEPLTPFGDFVDRAIASYPSLNNQYEDRGLAAEREVYHADPVFPSIADVPKQQDPVPETSTSTPPSATVSYKKLSEPLAEWIANYVWKVCTTGFSLPPAFAQSAMTASPYAVAPPSYLAPSIHTLLLSTLLQPSAVFLAVWYIVRLPVYFAAAPLGAELTKESAFRAAFLGESQDSLERQALENSAPFRLIVLGCMLANKWLDDHTFSNKTWHSISNIPVQTLNQLESLALDIYSYDLSISSQQWSHWLSHVLSYHSSLAPPGRPQPISRPSSNPHSIVRRSIEEIVHASSTFKATGASPQPVFLGLEDRLRERLEKEAAMDVLEIDLDEDGPLKEEYLPKRRASKLTSQNAQLGENWSASEPAPIKVLPPPAKWSPAGDEPILRDRNRSSGHYVAVQAPPHAHAAFHPQDPFNQNWNPPAAHMQVKSYPYEMPSHYRVNQAAYNPFGHIAHPHSRSQSLSYDQDNLLSRNHMRSYSQARFDYMRNDIRMSVGEQHIPIPEMESRWMDVAPHYPYSGPAFVPIPAVGMQPTW